MSADNLGTGDVELFVGPYVHSRETNVLELVPNGVIGICDGRIAIVDVEDNLRRIQKEHSVSSESVNRLREGEFLMPGLVDTHIHACQYPNSGLGMDLPLLDWLHKYTYPLEIKYSDMNYARNVYQKIVKRTLLNGTTTASYFATIHLSASKLLADIAEDFGQRAFIGKVNMDSNSPPDYIEETNASLRDTEEFVRYVLNKKNPLVQPVITPRFAPACTRELQIGLGKLASRYDVNIQSHLSENKEEVQWAKALFPEAANYADVYDTHKLLTDKTIMAHCVHLEREEITLLAERGTGIAHCPVSNFNLKSGLCLVKDLQNASSLVGLGTDVSAGHSPSLLTAMRSAMQVSNSLGFLQDKSQQPLTYENAVYLATLGGARALHIDHLVGNFQVGKDFDALLVNVESPESPIDVFSKLTFSETVQKFVMLGDDRNIMQVFVKGKRLETAGVHKMQKKFMAEYIQRKMQ